MTTSTKILAVILIGCVIAFRRDWIRKFVDWLDEHNGLMTFLATAAIAVLTYSLVTTSNGQLATLNRQLDDSEAIQRAHLMIVGPIVVTIEPVTYHEKGGDKTIQQLMGRISIRNVGNSVANEIGVMGGGVVGWAESYSNGPKMLAISQPNPSGGSIAAGESRAQGTIISGSEGDTEAYKNGTYRGYFGIVVSYVDIFGHKQVVADSFCYIPEHRDFESCSFGHTYD
jgi:hypothetical protein